MRPNANISGDGSCTPPEHKFHRRLFLQGLGTFDAAKRREIYTRLYRRLAEEQAANFLYHPHEIQAINKRVQGWPATDYRTALAFLNRVWLAG